MAIWYLCKYYNYACKIINLIWKKVMEKSDELYDGMYNIGMLLTCLKQSIDLCSRDNIEDCTHLLLLAEIISDKYEKLIFDFEKLILSG